MTSNLVSSSPLGFGQNGSFHAAGLETKDDREETDCVWSDPVPTDHQSLEG